jgi:chemotaxis protein histidine kinase CheA
MVHLLRNAVDHGIESPEQRRAAGKPETGRIALRARHEGDMISIVVEDDGRGVDWEAIRRRCTARGIPFGSHEALVAALFTDGVSTAEKVTDISGRGVGMAALQATVRALGGNIAIQSEWGRGARFTMSFPAPGAPATSGVVACADAPQVA